MANNSVDIATRLLKSKHADQLINMLNDKRQTALHIAASMNNASMVALLLRYGAKTNIPDKQYRLPADLTNDQHIQLLLQKAEQSPRFRKRTHGLINLGSATIAGGAIALTATGKGFIKKSVGAGGKLAELMGIENWPSSAYNALLFFIVFITLMIIAYCMIGARQLVKRCHFKRQLRDVESFGHANSPYKKKAPRPELLPLHQRDPIIKPHVLEKGITTTTTQIVIP